MSDGTLRALLLRSRSALDMEGGNDELVAEIGRALVGAATPETTSVAELMKGLRALPRYADGSLVFGEVVALAKQAAAALERLTTQCDELSSAGTGILEQGQAAIAREQRRAEAAETELARLALEATMKAEPVCWGKPDANGDWDTWPTQVEAELSGVGDAKPLYAGYPPTSLEAPAAWLIEEPDQHWTTNNPTIMEQFRRPGVAIIPLYAGHPPSADLDPAARLPADVRQLVIAARVVSLEDQSPEALKRLDVATEAFADRVPWDDEPEAATE